MECPTVYIPLLAVMLNLTAYRMSGLVRHLNRAEAGRRMSEGTHETYETAQEAVATVGRGRQAAREANERMEEFARVFAQAEIARVVDLVQAGMERVRSGQGAVATLVGVLDGMSAVITRTDGLAGTAERLSRQQLETHQEIVHGVGAIAAAADKRADGAEETASAVEEQVASFADLSRTAGDLALLASQLSEAVAGLTGYERGESLAVAAGGDPS